MSRMFVAGLVAALALLGPTASALVPAGSMRPKARVLDADDRVLELSAIEGKPILVLYEDRGSSKMNEAFKADLAKLANGDRYRTAIALVPVADVQAYDFWPARGFVKDSIRGESKKVGATIYCDWDGSFQRAAGFRRGTSSVMLVSRDGHVRFSSEGALSKEQRGRIIAMLQDEVGKPAAER